jgi:hypothetical protein
MVKACWKQTRLPGNKKAPGNKIRLRPLVFSDAVNLFCVVVALPAVLNRFPPTAVTIDNELSYAGRLVVTAFRFMAVQAVIRGSPINFPTPFI